MDIYQTHEKLREIIAEIRKGNNTLQKIANSSNFSNNDFVGLKLRLSKLRGERFRLEKTVAAYLNEHGEQLNGMCYACRTTKACGALTYLCCFCSDIRSDDAIYEYVDGIGQVRTVERDKYYCPRCRERLTT